MGENIGDASGVTARQALSLSPVAERSARAGSGRHDRRPALLRLGPGLAVEVSRRGAEAAGRHRPALGGAVPRHRSAAQRRRLVRRLRRPAGDQILSQARRPRPHLVGAACRRARPGFAPAFFHGENLESFRDSHRPSFRASGIEKPRCGYVAAGYLVKARTFPPRTPSSAARLSNACPRVSSFGPDGGGGSTAGFATIELSSTYR